MRVRSCVFYIVLSLWWLGKNFSICSVFTDVFLFIKRCLYEFESFMVISFCFIRRVALGKRFSEGKLHTWRWGGSKPFGSVSPDLHPSHLLYSRPFLDTLFDMLKVAALLHAHVNFVSPPMHTCTFVGRFLIRSVYISVNSADAHQICHINFF